MHRWKLSALAAAAFVSAALTSTDAAALALGPLSVQSALGEPLRAEIAISQATPAELNSLAVQIASPEIFRAQGMDYSNAARSIQVQLHRNADGTASLRLTSSTPLQDPFIDLVLQTQWSAGQMARSYTVLLDPPGTQRAAPAPTQAPQVAPAPAPASVTGRTYASNNAAPQRAARPAPAPSAAATTAEPGDKSARVRTGDTAGQIANAHRPAGVSLDQMLVAMLQSNPNAFINGNVNRIRAGAVVKMPSREQALETSAPEARQIVAAQSRDFNAYRRSLASKAPQAAVQAADRSSGGQVQAHVEDANPAAATPDKLTLSKSSVQSAAASDEKLAMQKQANDQSNRLNELQRNLAELNALTQTPGTTADTPATASPAASAPATAQATAEASPAPTLEIANPAATEPTAPTADGSATPPADSASSTAAPTAETASSTTTVDSAAPAAAKQKPAATPAPAPATPEPSLVGDLLENPLVPAGGGLIALLLGFLGYSAWKRRRAAQAAQDPSMGDSQLHTDSFFESSGGQQVDTSNEEAGASTMAYAPSQLDGGGDVDPVAEADVYLAYGRDVQAEEILKEALRTQPERLSIHVKLAEISVKRHDITALEAVARGMQEFSQPQDPEWQRVVEMGRNMDPNHPFFAAAASGAEATASKPTSAFAAALNSIKPEQAGSVAAAATAAAATAADKIPDIDLHLDLPDDGLASQVAPAQIPPATAPLPSEDDFAALDLPSALDSQLDLSTPSQPEDPPTLVQDTLMAEDNSATGLNDLDLDVSGFQMPPADATPPAQPEATPDPEDSLDFDVDTPVAQNPVTPTAPTTEKTPTSNPDLDFDLGSLDLDLGATPEPATSAQPVHNLADDPLSTKLDLAQEFNAIGDSEGARALIEEVLAEASGPLKERAQKMLSDID